MTENTSALKPIHPRRMRTQAVLRYGLAVLSVIVAAGLLSLMETHLRAAPHVSLFLAAIMFSSWFGGVRPGLLATALSILAFDYFFITPVHSLNVEAVQLPRSITFVASAFFGWCASGSARRTRNELQSGNHRLQEENDKRKRTEEVLRESQQQYETLVNTIDGIVWEMDAETFRFTFVNRQAKRILGYPIEDWFGENFWVNHLHPEDHEWALAFCLDATARRVDHQFEYRMIAADGRTVWLRDHVIVVARDNGSLRLRGVMVDITDRKIAERELRQEKEILEKIFDNVPVMLSFFDADGRAVLLNREWERTFGWSLAEVKEMGARLFDEFYPDPRERQRALDFLAASTGEWKEFKIRTRDGRARNIKWAIICLSDGTKVNIKRDITERKRAEEQLKRSNEELRALSARLHSVREEESARIAREIHDELGAELSSLKWDLEEIDEVISEPADAARLAALRKKIGDMIKLTDNAVDSVRRISSELRPTALDEFGLAEAIRWHAQQFQARTGIEVRCHCSPESGDLSREKATAIFRIFQEALTNILRHAQATQIDIKIRHESDYCVLTISDNGRGITEEEKTGSQSLGLLGMRERAHLLNGEISVEGVEGRGTIITLRVPILAKKAAGTRP